MALRQNLLPGSEDFSTTAWSKVGSTVSGNVALAPDGTMTADALVAADTTNTAHIVGAAEPIVITGDYATFSCFVKAGAVSWVRIMCDGTFAEAHFQLTGQGAVGAAPLGVLWADILAVEGAPGWYRCSITCRRTHAGGNLLARIYSASADGVSTYAAADAVSAQLYLWGGQYVQANHPGPYTKTPQTLAIDTGRLRDVAQEKQNIIVWSEDFSNAAWSKQAGVTITTNQAIAPDGTMTADLVDWSGAADSTGVFQTSVPIRVGNLYARSFWVRAVSGSATVRVTEASGGTVVEGAVDVAVGETWTKVTSVFRATAGNQSPWLQRKASSGNVYVWGAQLAEANHVGAYVKTQASRYDRGRIRDLPLGRQNLIPNSALSDAGTWTANGVLSTDTGLAAPDGSLTAFGLTDSVANTTHTYRRLATNAGRMGETFVMSCWLKKGSVSWALITVNSGADGVWFDLDTGAVGTETAATGRIKADVGGFFLCEVTYVQKIANVDILIYATTSNGGFGYLGTGARAMTLWHPQLAQGNSKGSDAPTSGTALGSSSGSRLRDVAPAMQNLTTRSEEFDNAAWGKSAMGSFVADAIPGPFPGTFGDKIVEDGTNGEHHMNHQTSSTVIRAGEVATFSVYAKAGERSWLVMTYVGLSNGRASFDLGSGALGTVQSNITAEIEPVKDMPGWYRCSITFFVPFGVSANGPQIFMAVGDSATGYQGNGASGFYLMGSQVVKANWPGDYVKTTTKVVSQGRIRDRDTRSQNLLVRSDELENAAWAPGTANITVTTPPASEVLGPYGVSPRKLTENGVNATHRMIQNAPTGMKHQGRTITFSCCLKKGTRRFAALLVGYASNFPIAFFDLDGGVPGSTAFGATSTMKALGDGWFRCTLTVRLTEEPGNYQLYMSNADTGPSIPAYQGDSASYFYATRGQLVVANWEGPPQATIATIVNTGKLRDAA